MSRTHQELNKIPKKSFDYIMFLRDRMRHFFAENNLDMANCYKDEARGYIKCLDDCGVASFKILWAWFTL